MILLEVGLLQMSSVRIDSAWRWEAPTQHDQCPYQRGKFGHRGTHREGHAELKAETGGCFHKPRNAEG